MSDRIDVDAILASLPTDVETDDSPWGTASWPCVGDDKCDTCRWLDEPDEAPALRGAFARPRRFEACDAPCCREPVSSSGDGGTRT